MDVCLSVVSTLTVWGQTNFRKSEIKEVMKRVADWQIANPDQRHEHGDLDWTNAALYMGMIDWAELTEGEDGNRTYYDWLLKIGRRNHFRWGNGCTMPTLLPWGSLSLICIRSIRNRR